MKKFALALAGMSVAIGGLAATPAAASDFGRGGDRGRYEQVQNRGNDNRNIQNRGFENRGFANRGAENRVYSNGGYQDHRWQRGERFDPQFASDYMVISDPGYYNLGPAPYGYRWVRSGNNAILVAIASGIIGALAANAF